MKLRIQQDVEAPIDFVFAQMTDFKTIERSAMRRGAEVQRVDMLKQDGPGMAWDAKFVMRGKLREVNIEISDWEPPNRLSVSSRSPNMGGKMQVELLSLSRKRTRIMSDIVLDPKNLSAKLLVQSMKLARKNINKRLTMRSADYAKELETRYKAAT